MNYVNLVGSYELQWGRRHEWLSTAALHLSRCEFQIVSERKGPRCQNVWKLGVTLKLLTWILVAAWERLRLATGIIGEGKRTWFSSDSAFGIMIWGSWVYRVLPSCQVLQKRFSWKNRKRLLLGKWISRSGAYGRGVIPRANTSKRVPWGVRIGCRRFKDMMGGLFVFWDISRTTSVWLMYWL